MRKHATPIQPPAADLRFLSDGEHYEEVVERMRSVKKTLWVGTADIKDLYVKAGRSSRPLLGLFSDLTAAGVEIRLIHAKEPGAVFREEFDRYPLLRRMERVLCPRVHFKIVIFDLKAAYVGSANLTGAGLGMKGAGTRNFEAGVFGTRRDFVDAAVREFDAVWMGRHCQSCRRRAFCGDPILSIMHEKIFDNITP